jgi:hypothetical protein
LQKPKARTLPQNGSWLSKDYKHYDNIDTIFNQLKKLDKEMSI